MPTPFGPVKPVIRVKGEDEAVRLRFHERPFPPLPLLRRLDRGQRARDAPAHRLDVLLRPFGVLLQEDLSGNGLGRHGGVCRRNKGFGIVAFHRNSRVGQPLPNARNIVPLNQSRIFSRADIQFHALGRLFDAGEEGPWSATLGGRGLP